MIQSPCNKICTLNSNNICIGCGRSRAEIGGWSQFPDQEKAQVVKRAKARLETMGAANAPAKARS
jgi:predicted Fe-S protein YdhL (DUF1289 family)